MSLDNFQMPDELVVELYKDSLIDLDEKQNVTESLKITSPAYLGDYRKKILITVSDSQSLYLSDKDLQQLTAILNACGLSFADVALMNLHQHAKDVIMQQLSTLQPLVIISFTDLTIPYLTSPPANKFEITQKIDQTIVLSSPLSELPGDKQARMQLWQCLQQIFPKKNEP